MGAGAAELTACALWRKHKIIYQFDQDLALELAAQADSFDESSDLPVDAILHPPYPCIYIKCPGIVSEDSDGFFAFIEFDINRSVHEIRFSEMALDMMHTRPIVIDLSSQILGQCIAATVEEAARHSQSPMAILSAKQILPALRALNIYLYVCSSGADIEPNPSHAQVLRKSSTVRDKYREIDVQDVGVRIGQALRRYRVGNTNTGESKNVGERRSPRPHTRRGHWHHYWTGSKSERTLVLKWVHPVAVAIQATDEDVNPTVIPIKNHHDS